MYARRQMGGMLIVILALAKRMNEAGMVVSRSPR